MPVSKKRKKKGTKPSGPPPSKAEVSGKKRKLSRQQILIYIFSALIIISLAASFIIGSSTPAPARTHRRPTRKIEPTARRDVAKQGKMGYSLPYVFAEVVLM